MDYNITWRKKDKAWQCIISYKDNFGKWKQRSKQGFKTQKEGKEWIETTLKELKKAAKNNSPINVTTEITFKNFFKYFIEHQALYKEYSTLKGYKNTFSKFCDLKSKKIKDIKRLDIQKCIDNMVKSKLKSATIKTYILRLRVIFEYYKESYDEFFDNPVTAFNIPKDKKETSKKALTKKELDKLLLDLKKNKFYMVAFIAANTGLRCGEILGLTWVDLNEVSMTLNVNKQWKVLKNKKSGFGELKTKNSNRKVPISSKILKELKKYKRETPISIDNRITPFNKCSIEKYLNPKLRELAGISIHELRHTYATLLISSGIDFKTAASILGHTVEMTMKTYSHVNDDMIKNAIEKINDIF